MIAYHVRKGSVPYVENLKHVGVYKDIDGLIGWLLDNGYVRRISEFDKPSERRYENQEADNDNWYFIDEYTVEDEYESE